MLKKIMKTKTSQPVVSHVNSNFKDEEDTNLLPNKTDLSVFVVLQKDNKYYIHNTNNKEAIKNTITNLYKNEGEIFDDVSMNGKAGTNESFNVNGTKKSYGEINRSSGFGTTFQYSDSSVNSKNSHESGLGRLGGKPSSHLKYKKRTTSQKRRKLNIKTLKLKS
jgi:hypothetical protein